MALEEKDYQEIKAALTAPDGGGLSPEERPQFEAMAKEYEAAQYGPPAPAPELPAPEEDYGPPVAPPDVGPQPTDMDPSVSLPAQALAVQPAVAGPPEMEANPQGWLESKRQLMADKKLGDYVAQPEGSAGGEDTVFFYEPPLSWVKTYVAQHPEVMQLAYPELARVNPEDPGAGVPLQEIEAMTTDHELYKLVSDMKWREAAMASKEAGKAAYRYSKAPWLQGKENWSIFETLDLKLSGALGSAAGPVAKGGRALILGLDDTAALGAGRALSEGAEEALTDQSGFVDYNAQSQEESPGAYATGQAIGMFTPWGAANRLYDFVAKGGQSLAKGAVGRAVTSTGAAAAAGVAEQTGREAVQTAATGEIPEGAGGRIAESGLYSGATGGLVEGGGQIAEYLTDAVRKGGHFRQIPALLEKHGVKFSVLKGVEVPPEVKAIVEEAERVGYDPRDLAARRISPQMLKTLEETENASRKAIEEAKGAYYASREGQMQLPLNNASKTTLDHLDGVHNIVQGRRVAVDKELASEYKDIFNRNMVGNVKVKPTPGEHDLVLTPAQAEAYLDDHWQAQLRARLHEPTPMDRVERVHADNDASLPPQEGKGLAAELKRRGITQVVVEPQRMNAEKTEKMMKSFQAWKEKSGSEALSKIDEMAREDRRARPMDGKPGGWSDLQGEHEKIVLTNKALRKHTAGTGDEVAQKQQLEQRIATYGQPGPGKAEGTEQLRTLAGKAGERYGLDQAGLINPLQSLRDQTRMVGGKQGGGADRAFAFTPASIADSLTMRAFPVMRAAGKETSAVRGGRAGITMTLDPLQSLRDQLTSVVAGREEPNAPPPELRGKPVTDPAVQAWLNRKKEARP